VQLNQLSCPGVVEDVHRMGKLAASLYVLRNAWPGSPEPNRAEMLLGVAAFLHVNPHVPKEELAERLNRFAPRELIDMAVASSRANVERRLWVHTFNQLVDHYNYNKQKRVSRVEIPRSAPRIWFL
jgi:hypothetical protein